MDFAIRIALRAIFALAAAQVWSAEPLKGGIEQRVPDDPYARARRAPAPALCSAYEGLVPDGGRLHVFPKTAGGKIPLPQKRPMEDRCEAPSASLRLVGEDRNYCCYVQSRNTNGPEPVIDVFDDPPQRDEEVPPSRVPPTNTPPDDDPGYWAGAQSGFRNCGESVQVMLQALQAMSRNDFVTAARLLGATDSGAGLRSLWTQIAGIPVMTVNGKELTQFEVGQRQAERICLYVLLPKASSCAVKGTACAVRGAATQCATWSRRIAQLRPIRLSIRLPPAQTPILRGMLLPDEMFLKQLAAAEQLIFIVRDSNRMSMRWIGREGYGPKPLDVKGKTLQLDDFAGAPAGDANRYAGLASARGMDAAARAELTDAGYSIASKAEQEIIRGPGGANGFYSDVDLHGVYKVGGAQGWADVLRRKLDCHFFDRGVQHGPHDVWPDRNNLAKAGPNYGPQVSPKKPLTAYLPDGRTLTISTLEQMKGFYRDIGVDFNAIYPNH